MRAICQADYNRIKKAQQYIESNPRFSKKVYLDRVDEEELEPLEIKKLGFTEVYGVWFDLGLSSYFREQLECNYRTVFINKKHEDIAVGIHKIRVINQEGALYFWRAQGYPRGIVTLEEDRERIEPLAKKFLENATWNWSELLHL